MFCIRVTLFLILAGIFLSCEDADVPYSTEGVKDLSGLPNVIFILADDVGYGDLACYGHPYALTPNLDNLAKQGMLLTNFYVTGSTCVPSRTGFMTGKNPAAFSLYPREHGFQGRTTITEILDSIGYATGHVGKWSIGPMPERGDQTYGIEDIRIIESNDEAKLGRDEDIFNAAMDFINEKKSQPFYLNIWCRTTHFPVQPNDSVLALMPEIEVSSDDFGYWFNKEKLDIVIRDSIDADHAMRNYLAEITALDKNIGRIIDTLKQLGIFDKSIIAFSSDQGPAPIQSPKDLSTEKERLKMNMLGYAGGLRGGKHDFYEGGVRVPFIISWPESIPAGNIDSTSVVSGLDWLPTLCDITGVKLNKQIFHGQSVLGVLKGRPQKDFLPLFWQKHGQKEVTTRWKDWKYHEKQEGSDQLFSMSEDPLEKQNVIEDHPEVQLKIREAIDNFKRQMKTER